MIKVVVAGAAGRMGQAIIAEAQRYPLLKVIYGLENSSVNTIAHLGQNSHDFEIGSDLSRVANADVVIDFSVPEATLRIAAIAAQFKKPMVIGTTGFSLVQERKLRRVLKPVAVLKSANMSIGVNVFFKIAKEAAKVFRNYDVKIEETHHVHKKDSPSGTALQVGKLMEEFLEKKIVYDPKREGEVIGDHRVIFSSPLESLELFHHAKSRSMFAMGALFAAVWISEKRRGFYTMQDALGLK
jgi:4-hydroxy-tetrahydrodipicolinate reductase